jgi:hypothetical protein
MAGLRDQISKPGWFDKKVMGLAGSGGFYQPLLNRTVIPEETISNDGYDPGYSGQNVVAHELEHRRQFNHPGDYTSYDARRIASDMDKRTGKSVSGMGYSKADLPFEMLAFGAGANAADGSVGLRQAQYPHPGAAELTKEQKLWMLKNRDGWMTDQNYLGNLQTYGEPVAQGIERGKHLLKQFGSRFMSTFDGLRGR